MCLAVPARIVEIESPDRAVVDLAGVRRVVSLMLTPEARVGDYAIIHTGFAIGILDEGAAQASLDALAQIAALSEQENREFAAEDVDRGPSQ